MLNEHATYSIGEGRAADALMGEGKRVSQFCNLPLASTGDILVLRVGKEYTFQN
jgi:hypothetical protein